MAIELRFGCEENNIAIRPFVSLLRMYVRGVLTKNQMFDYFKIMVNNVYNQDEINDILFLVNQIDLLSTEVEKLAFVLRIQDTLVLCEYKKLISQATVKTLLGF